MDNTQILMIILFVVLIFLSAFFSMSETAILSLNKIHIRTLSEEGNRKAFLLNKLLDEQDRIVSTILVGNNLVNIAASSLTTSFVISIFGNEGIGVAIATGFVTLVILVFGEITPKSFAVKNADEISLRIISIIHFFMLLFSPVVFILNALTHLMIQIVGADEDKPTMTEEDLKTMVSVSTEEGVLEEDEKEMIHNVFEFKDTEIKEIMTPRVNVISLPEDCDYNEMIKTVREYEFSRIPVFNESYDEIIGVLYIKDLLISKVVKSKFNIKEFLKEPYFVYEFNSVNDVFESMRKDHASLAVVLDEYGVMSGIVSLEDIVEEIVGEINDEYDDPLIEEIETNHFIIDGSTDIDEVNEICGTKIESEDFESIGGLLLGLTQGDIEEDKQIEYEGLSFIIQEIDKNRISKLEMIIKESQNLES